MPNTYFTSDTHFGDFRQKEVLGKPIHLYLRPFKSLEEQDDFLVEQWNKIVQPDDIVWHLGDFAISTEALKKREKLNGTIHLIRGNKEDLFTDEVLKPYFQSVQQNAYYTLPDGEEVFLTHYPVTAIKDKFNLVGHIHKMWTFQTNMLNVGVDVWNWQPISEAELLHAIWAIRNIYDQDCFAAYLETNEAHKKDIQQINSSYYWIKNKKENS